jgi:hypothetical protein
LVLLHLAAATSVSHEILERMEPRATIDGTVPPANSPADPPALPTDLLDLPLPLE